MGLLKKTKRDDVGHTDTTNYKQDVIAKNIKAISAVEVGMVHLALF